MISRRLLLSAAAAASAGFAHPSRAYVPWHKEAFSEVQADIKSLCSHPFILGLINGSLKQECFLWYLCQNRHYLAGYEKSLRTLALRMKTAKSRKQLLCWAEDTVATDLWTRDVIDEFSKGKNTASYALLRPTTQRYITWESDAVKNETLPVAWAALLPCFWVYGEVGHFVAKNRNSASSYASWLAGYGDSAYDTTVEKAVALADRLVMLNPKRRFQATSAFVKSVKFEVALWDDAIKLA